ncbi:metallophosphoesterase [Streptomyces sp. NPDC048611]|uniref:metallophosphoesterase n=1 Tax=Streptomyces sp. NPDC048611 TaxID=3155635 RepID=UPI0034142B19
MLVTVGDLVDRGPAPGAVVRLLRERPNSVVVMGNHERKHVRVISYVQTSLAPPTSVSRPCRHNAVSDLRAAPSAAWRERW